MRGMESGQKGETGIMGIRRTPSNRTCLGLIPLMPLTILVFLVFPGISCLEAAGYQPAGAAVPAPAIRLLEMGTGQIPAGEMEADRSPENLTDATCDCLGLMG